MPSMQPNRTRKREIQALYLRGCLTIQNHNKRKHRQDVISKNKHPISQNIQLWDSLLSAGFSDFGDGHDAFACVGGRDRCVDHEFCGVEWVTGSHAFWVTHAMKKLICSVILFIPAYVRSWFCLF